MEAKDPIDTSLGLALFRRLRSSTSPGLTPGVVMENASFAKLSTPALTNTAISALDNPWLLAREVSTAFDSRRAAITPVDVQQRSK